MKRGEIIGGQKSLKEKKLLGVGVGIFEFEE
jgi:hypothetical protein